MKQSHKTSIFKIFLDAKLDSSAILFGCFILSLLIANSPFRESFTDLLETKVGFSFSSIDLKHSISMWINDGLMAIFFLSVGLEIKQELVGGHLSSLKKALLPVLCAIGGAIIPALIYMLFNNEQATEKGWGIPMATDIAFALAILSMLSDKVPVSLKIFLTALAIVDDLLAIIVIAIFYSSQLHYLNLVIAGAIFLLLLLFNKFGVKNLLFYLIPGLFIWYFVHHSGIHATIAGVLVALTIPTRTTNQQSPLEKLEHILKKPVNFFIIPIFALANTNIHFEPAMLKGLFSGLGIGIVLGLLLGKPLGILFVSWISIKTGLARLPENANWQHIAGLGMLGGIGFTMSIFIALLSFSDPALVAEAKFSILIGSVLSGLMGYLILRNTTK